MQRNLSAGMLAALLLGTGVAFGAVVSVPELPQFEMARAPIDPPPFVSAGAHVKGLFVAPGPTRTVNFRVVQIFTSAGEAAEFSKRGSVQRDETQTPSPCTYVAEDPDDFGEPWTAVASASFAHVQGSDRPPVVALHVETMEGEWTKERGGSLGIVDGWLDMRSRGLRVVEQKTMQVKQVAEGPFGVRVFAARGADTVHFVVLPPVFAKPIHPFLGLPFERPVIRSGGVIGASDCRHARVTLEAVRGKGTRATVSFQQPRTVTADPVDGKDENDARQSTSTIQVLQVHLSASENASGAAPVVSVGFQLDAPQNLE